ncbi:MAG: lysoplasmalogenase [Pseudomonadota bacterium]
MHAFLIAISIVSAFAYGTKFTVQKPSVNRTVVKMLAVGSLVILGLHQTVPLPLLLALIFGTVGDGFLSRDGDKNFLAGLAAFLIGHICYIVLFVNVGAEFGALTEYTTRITIAAFLIIIAVGVTISITPHLKELKLPVYAYVAISLVLGIAALMLPGSNAFLIVTLGAFMFITSDIILAYDLFVIPQESEVHDISARALWFLYWGGQLLIFWGITQAAL